jgi:hypothetical protein
MIKHRILVKATRESEAGMMAGADPLSAMQQYHEERVNAGVLVDAAGPKPTAKGWRVRYAGGKRTVIDGPFAETKELIAGYTIIDVTSRAEAIAWARRFPHPAIDGGACEIEVRECFEPEDFGDSPAIERFRAMEQKPKEKAAK